MGFSRADRSRSCGSSFPFAQGCWVFLLAHEIIKGTSYFGKETYIVTPSDEKKITLFLLTLMGVHGISSKTLNSMISARAKDIASASSFDPDFVASLGIKRISNALEKSDLSWDALTEQAYETLSLASDSFISVLNPFMDDYPKRMLRNESFPPLLYCRGNLESLNTEKAVAIVGTRNPTEFGARMGHRLAELLSQDGYAIISGLALGSDSVGHEGALDADGVTVAVLPTPLDRQVYPRKNAALAERILDNGGALVSEYAPGTEVVDRQLAGNLVARDEWQPALADGLVAIETTKDGGTRHAVKHALETSTPVAVFDYRPNPKIDFGDSRFSGNVDLLDSGKASRIYEPETIDAFKAKMDDYRNGLGSENDGDASGSQGQMPLMFD